MTVHQYDIVLDVTVINRTADTLQNLCLELATMGDLKLVERPQNYTLGPGATRTVRCAPPRHALLAHPGMSDVMACRANSGHRSHVILCAHSVRES